ncbi:ADP-ribosylation factor 4, partial [Podila verticillata]
MDLRLLILGLHAAGKTAFLYKLKLGDIVTTIPTIGLNVENSGGSCGLRRQWRHFYQDTAGIIFVVDSNDRDRISEAREDLHRMSNEDTLCDVVFLIIANKQDIPGYMTVMEVYEALRLDQLVKIGKHRVHIQPCSVLQGQ